MPAGGAGRAAELIIRSTLGLRLASRLTSYESLIRLTSPVNRRQPGCRHLSNGEQRASYREWPPSSDHESPTAQSTRCDHWAGAAATPPIPPRAHEGSSTGRRVPHVPSRGRRGPSHRTGSAWWTMTACEDDRLTKPSRAHSVPSRCGAPVACERTAATRCAIAQRNCRGGFGERGTSGLGARRHRVRRPRCRNGAS